MVLVLKRLSLELVLLFLSVQYLTSIQITPLILVYYKPINSNSRHPKLPLAQVSTQMALLLHFLENEIFLVQMLLPTILQKLDALLNEPKFPKLYMVPFNKLEGLWPPIKIMHAFHFFWSTNFVLFSDHKKSRNVDSCDFRNGVYVHHIEA